MVFLPRKFAALETAASWQRSTVRLSEYRQVLEVSTEVCETSSQIDKFLLVVQLPVCNVTFARSGKDSDIFVSRVLS